MDDQLKKALEFSNYRQTFAIQHKTLKEKIQARLTYGHNGGIFKIDQTLLNFVENLVNQGRTSGIPLLDANDNPIMIEDMNQFREEIYDRYFTSTYEYYEQYEALKKSRSVEKILDL
jgi:hypothetical protein